MSQIKFHTTLQGEPRRCYAKAGRCLYGYDEPHYATKEEARSAYEEKMANLLIGSSVS